MTPAKESITPQSAPLHLIAGPGACRTIAGTPGFLMALWWFGRRSFQTVGGVSGGSLPMSLFAGGRTVAQIIDLAMTLDFQSLLDQDQRFTSVMLNHLWQRRYRGELPETGQYRMQRLASWLEKECGDNWPDAIPFWTMATDESGAQVLFTKSGIFRREQGGLFTPVSDRAPPLGSSICASCTVPGFFVPQSVILDNGEVLTLYDGALSWEGMRPISVVEQHYQASPGQIVMFDVGFELNRYDQILAAAWTYICGGRCVPPRGLDRTRSAPTPVIVHAPISRLRSFDFSAHPDKRWTAVMESFAATAFAFNNAYLLHEDKFLEAKDILSEYNGFASAWQRLPEGELSRRTEALLARRGVLQS